MAGVARTGTLGRRGATQPGLRSARNGMTPGRSEQMFEQVSGQSVGSVQTLVDPTDPARSSADEHPENRRVPQDDHPVQGNDCCDGYLAEA